MKKIIFTVIILISICGKSYSQQQYSDWYFWTGNGSNNLASDPGNWFYNVAPVPDKYIAFTDIAVIGKSAVWDLETFMIFLELVQGEFYEDVFIDAKLIIKDFVQVGDGRLIIDTGVLQIGQVPDEDIKIIQGVAGILSAFVLWGAIISAS